MPLERRERAHAASTLMPPRQTLPGRFAHRESPITAIPSYMVGAIVGSTAAVWLGAVQWFPESAIWAWPLVTNLGVYMAGIALGAVITALMVVFLRLMMFRKGKLLIDSL